VLGDAQPPRHEHSVRFRGAEGGEHGRPPLVHRVQDVGQQVERFNVDRTDLVGVVIAQEPREIRHGVGYGAVRVAVGAVERLAGMGVDEGEASGKRGRGDRATDRRHQHAAADEKFAASHGHWGHGGQTTTETPVRQIPRSILEDKRPDELSSVVGAIGSGYPGTSLV